MFREKNPRSDVEASHEILTDGGAALHYVRFRDPASGRPYDVFELYWAPLKVAKISAWRVAWWLGAVAFAPLASFNANLPLLVERARSGKDLMSFGAVLLVLLLVLREFAYEAGRVLSLPLLLVGLLAAVAVLSFAAVTRGTALYRRITDIDFASLSVPDWLTLLALTLASVGALALLASVPLQVRDIYVRVRDVYVWLRQLPVNAADASDLLAYVGEQLRREITTTWRRFWGRKRDDTWAAIGGTPTVESPMSDTPPTAPQPVRKMTLSEAKAMRQQIKTISRRWSAFTFGLTAVPMMVIEVSFQMFARPTILIMSIAAGLITLVGVATVLRHGRAACVLHFCIPGGAGDVVQRLGSTGVLEIATVALFVIGLLIIKRVFLDFLGDVALYTTADETSRFAETRRLVLAEATRMTKLLLGRYHSVVIVGHSLGSVVGYDVLNQLAVEASIGGSMDVDMRAGLDGPGQSIIGPRAFKRLACFIHERTRTSARRPQMRPQRHVVRDAQEFGAPLR